MADKTARQRFDELRESFSEYESDGSMYSKLRTLTGQFIQELDSRQPPTDQPAAGVDLFKRLPELVARDVAEIPDRSSPDDFPEAMLVTGPELIDIVHRNIELIAESHSVPCAAQETPIDLQELKRLAEKVTPQDLNSAELIELDQVHDCPFCDGDGSVDADTYTNYDGVAIGVQFFGIGQEFLDAKNYFRAVAPKKILALISELSALRSTASVKDGPVTVAGCRSMARFWTKLAERKEQESTHPADSNKGGEMECSAIQPRDRMIEAEALRLVVQEKSLEAAKQKQRADDLETEVVVLRARLKNISALIADISGACEAAQ